MSKKALSDLRGGNQVINAGNPQAIYSTQSGRCTEKRIQLQTAGSLLLLREAPLAL